MSIWLSSDSDLASKTTALWRWCSRDLCQGFSVISVFLMCQNLCYQNRSLCVLIISCHCTYFRFRSCTNNIQLIWMVWFVVTFAMSTKLWWIPWCCLATFDVFVGSFLSCMYRFHSLIAVLPHIIIRVLTVLVKPKHLSLFQKDRVFIRFGIYLPPNFFFCRLVDWSFLIAGANWVEPQAAEDEPSGIQGRHERGPHKTQDVEGPSRCRGWRQGMIPNLGSRA